jgi:ribonuclease HI
MIKSQALANLIVEWTDYWEMYFDGSYTLKGARPSVVLIPLEGAILKYAFQFEFSATNNIAKYAGLVTGLRLAKDLGIQRLLIRGHS